MENKLVLKSTETTRKISFIRVMMVLVVIVGFSYGTLLSFDKRQESIFANNYRPWFAAYVDVTSIPTYSFEQADQENSQVVLAFIVASLSEPCDPTWGGYYTLTKAAEVLDLDRRIARFQQQGGKIAVSFGGALNSELALSCTDSEALLAAYEAVIERYNINTIDLDLENEGLSNLEASKRRAEVIAKLQEEYRQQGRDLAIWLTLPVIPQGLTKEGTDVVIQMLKSGVDLAGVNLMTMDYGAAKDKSDTMSDASIKALIETHRQLAIIYKQSGINLDSGSIWRKIGTTPMLGQNDILGEVFSLDDAKSLNEFALLNGLGRVSMWSANRDIPCGVNYVDLKVVSDLCSGVTAPAYSFANTLGNGFEGDLMQNAKMITIADEELNVQVVDNPETSPYQIWRETGVYLKETKVVWHGNVYEAKWWTKNDLPDNPVLQAWETPWQLIGPVLPGDRPMEQLVLPQNIFPKWSGKQVYEAGDRVLFEDVPFRAKWWNQGESPAASVANPDSSPWIPLTQPQVMEIIKRTAN